MARYVDCHKCKHYYVTWDKSLPHGCRAFGFKSKNMPSYTVSRDSGMACLMYDIKQATNQSFPTSHQSTQSKGWVA